MSNPFSDKPTIIEEVEQDDDDGDKNWGEDVSRPDPSNPVGVQEDYDRVPATGNEVEDDDGEADEEWAQTPVDLFASMEQDDFWWVVVTVSEEFTMGGGEVNQRDIPKVQSRYKDYEEFLEARDEYDDDELPEGIHVQSCGSSKVRYVKGDDQQNLLEWRDLA